MTFFKSLPDIVGTGAVVNLGAQATAISYPTKATWVQIFKSNTSGVSRLGGSEVSATRGLPIGSLGYFFSPRDGADITAYSDLNMINIYVAAGDTVYVLYGG